MLGLRPQDRALVNAACGGSVLNKLPSQALKLFADMAEETRDEPIDVPRASPVEQSASDAKLDKMCTPLEQIVNMNGPQKKGVRACQLCFATSHMTDECPEVVLQEEVKILGHNQGSGGNGYPMYDPNSQFYNLGWRDHKNFKWGPKPQQQPQHQQGQHQQNRPSLAEMVHTMARDNSKTQADFEKFRMETQGAIQHINTQLGQLTQTLSRLEKKQGELPSQVEINHARVKAISTRSGKQLPEMKQPEVEREIELSKKDDKKKDEEAVVPRPYKPRHLFHEGWPGTKKQSNWVRCIKSSKR